MGGHVEKNYIIKYLHDPFGYIDIIEETGNMSGANLTGQGDEIAHGK